MRSLFPFLVVILALVTTAEAQSKAPAQACLQAPGYSRIMELGSNSRFCALESAVEKKDAKMISERVKELDKEYGPYTDDYEGESGYEISLFIGFHQTSRLAKKLGAPYSLINDAGIYTIFAYSYWGYQGYNEVLWKGASDDEDVRGEIRALSAALNALPPYEGTTVRVELNPTREEEVAGLEKRLEGYKVGEAFQARGFYSTSKIPDFGSGLIRLHIKGKSGRYIAPLSSIPAEEEVLFPPGVWFKVISKEKRPFKPNEQHPFDYQWHVELEEI